MAKVDIAGLGVWSPVFSDWSTFRAGLESGEWSPSAGLQPELIPPRERRRAPQLVKMAIEVMDQACKMAAISPTDAAVVFSSAMGDMQITDYLCRTLAEPPKLVSPTRFHNSVHNAAPGYWSITTGAFTPATAVSAHEHSASMALLEASVQVDEEGIPVLLVTQEIAAPLPLFETCPSEQPFSAAFLLVPPGSCETAMASFEFTVDAEAGGWPPVNAALSANFGSNFGARLLPLLEALAADVAEQQFDFPISDTSALSVSLHRS